MFQIAKREKKANLESWNAVKMILKIKVQAERLEPFISKHLICFFKNQLLFFGQWSFAKSYSGLLSIKSYLIVISSISKIKFVPAH